MEEKDMTRKYKGPHSHEKPATSGELLRDHLRPSNAPGSRQIEDLQDQVRGLVDIVATLVQALDDSGVMTPEQVLKVVQRDWYSEET